MNIPKSLYYVMIPICSLMSVTAEAAPQKCQAESPEVVVDTRRSFGGILVRDTVRIHATAQESVTVDGRRISPQAWDTTHVPDGPHEAILAPQGQTTFLCVLNDAHVDIHGGPLDKSQEWDAHKTHVIKHWVRIPKGMTLTIKEGTVVKFCSQTGFHVEGTLNVERGAYLTSVADDSQGGDTDFTPETRRTEYGQYAIAGAGQIQVPTGTFLPSTDLANSQTQVVWNNLKPGWNLVGIPWDISLLFADYVDYVLNEFKLFTLDANGCYVVSTNLKPGSAHWIYLDKDSSFTTLQLAGRKNTGKVSSPTLHHGWNLVMNPGRSHYSSGWEWCNWSSQFDIFWGGTAPCPGLFYCP